MNRFVNRLTHIGDILATPFFILLSIYFYRIENKSPLEYILFLFSISCFIIDFTFSYFYMTGKIKNKR
jgi:hypothetical protein